MRLSLKASSFAKNKAPLYIAVILLAVTAFSLMNSAIFAENTATTDQKNGRKIVLPRKLRDFLLATGSAKPLKDATSGGTKRDESTSQIRMHWLTMYERMQKAVVHEDNLIKRLESRVAKLKQEGKDTSQAERAITGAKTKLQIAVNDLAKLEAKSKELETSPNPRQLVQTMMQDVKKIKKQLQEVHRLLQSTLPLLKGIGSKDASSSATSSGSLLKRR